MTLDSQLLFIIDFDGTVAPVDTVDALLERFAAPEWRAVEEEWAKGAIDSRQCMSRQIALVRGEQSEIEEFLYSVEIDPWFPHFVHYARQIAELAVVSDGLDEPIHRALRGLGIPIYANRMDFLPGGLGISFPYTNRACTVGSGVCKCAVARSLDSGRGLTTVLIGDGRSDFCLARSADFVFAKGTLRRMCEAENIIYTPFETFGDVLTIVRSWSAPDCTKAGEAAHVT